MAQVAESRPAKRIRITSNGKRVTGASLKGDAIPLGKYLASNEKSVRDKAVEALRLFLSSSPGSTTKGKSSLLSQPNDVFSPENVTASRSSPWQAATTGASVLDARLGAKELAVLFKGLFYCFWMSDKPLVQQDLALHLSDLCLITKSKSHPKISDETEVNHHRVIQDTRAGFEFWKAFWIAIMMEWHKLDRHRMDKYLMLVRKFWSVGYKLLERIEWRSEAVEDWSHILRSTVLNVEDNKTPISLVYHVTDIALTELNSIVNSTNPIPLVPLLTPFFQVMAHAPAGTAILRRIRSSILDGLLTTSNDNLSSLKDSCTDQIGNQVQPLSQVMKSVLKAMWNEAAKSSTLDANRREMYAMWRELSNEVEVEDDV